MNIFITGVDGFLGSNLAKFHLDRGDNVTGVDQQAAHQLIHCSPLLTLRHFRYFQMDLSQAHDYNGRLKDIELVYHFAAKVGVFEELKHPEEVLNTNINATAHLLKAIVKEAKDAKVILASSSEVYGGRLGLCREAHESPHFLKTQKKAFPIRLTLQKFVKSIQYFS